MAGEIRGLKGFLPLTYVRGSVTGLAEGDFLIGDTGPGLLGLALAGAGRLAEFGNAEEGLKSGAEAPGGLKSNAT